MEETEYQLECNRAELLGVPKPDREEFMAKFENLPKDNTEDAEEVPTESPEDIEARKEGMRKINKGLEEINTILLNTQKKLKNVYGNLGKALNLPTSSNGKSQDQEDQSTSEVDSSNAQPPEGGNEESESSQSDPKGKPDGKLGKIHSIIKKAEKAHTTLANQNKQMRRFFF